VIEAILFASQKAVSPKELVAHLRNASSSAPESAASAFAKIRESDVRDALEELRAEVGASGRAYQVRENATGWLLCSAPGFAPWLRALYPEAKTQRLSAPALETLAIIAYRQPITRADIEAVRGVAVDGVMQTILDRGLIRIAGRAETPGRPLLYSTTQFFLDHFGLRHLDELPNAAELRHIPLPKAPSGEEPAEGTPAEGTGMEGESADPVETPVAVEVTEILEVRESVVLEELERQEEAEGPDSGTPSGF
jgi:segregation and condensation protein B